MLALLFACASGEDDSGDPSGTQADFWAPDAPGPFGVGTFESRLVADGGLTLPVQVWYPTTETSGSAYLYDDFLPGTAWDTPASACDRPRPVLLFSHGSGGVRYQSIYLTEFLATHGWIVVAPDHVGNTAFDDGSVPVGEVMLRRPVDIRNSFDWLVSTGADAVLDGCVDAAAGYAVAGHSFGGYTTMAVSGAAFDVGAAQAYCIDHGEWLCGEVDAYAAEHGTSPVDLSDPRAWAGVAMAPAGYEVLVGGLPTQHVPTFLLGGTRDTLTPVATQVRPYFETTGGAPDDLAVLEDAGHYTFSDACAMLPTFDDCSPPYLDPDVAHALLATMTTAFLDRARGADTDAWLPPDDPLVTWESR